MSYSNRFVTNVPLRTGECKNETCYKPTTKELKYHSNKEDCWVTINGVVYNVSKYKKDLKEKLTKRENEKYELELTESGLTQDKKDKLEDQHKERMKYINNYKLGLICGKKYENRNENNIFHKDLNYKNYSVGALKYYKLYKLLVVLLNFLVLVAIGYIMLNKMDNNYIVMYVLLPLIFYMLYSVYKFTDVYIGRQVKVARTENEIKNVSSAAPSSITLLKMKNVLKELEQRVLLIFLMLLLIVIVIIYGMFKKIENLYILITIIGIILMYVLLDMIKTKISKDEPRRWKSPSS